MKHTLEEEEHTSARVAVVRPDAVCELQTLAKSPRVQGHLSKKKIGLTDNWHSIGLSSIGLSRIGLSSIQPGIRKSPVFLSLSLSLCMRNGSGRAAIGQQTHKTEVEAELGMVSREVLLGR